MALVLAWLAYPVVLAVVSLGCGLLLKRVARQSLPGVLLVPAGFAVVVVEGSFTTMGGATASLTTPFVVVLAVVGFALSTRFRPRLDGWAAGAAVAVFAVYAAPIVLTGGVTFAGYLSLPDGANWLALAVNSVVNGRGVGGVAASSYSFVLDGYLSSGYPLGSFLPLGIGQQLTRQDAAWLFQPQIAFMAAILGLGVYGLSGPLLRSRVLRAAVAFLGPLSALLFGYAFWSGIKEVTVAALVAVLAAVVASHGRGRWQVRDLLPVAVLAAAVLDCLAVTGTVWLAALGVLAAVLFATAGRRRGALLTAALAAMTAVLAIPALAIAQVFVQVAQASGSGSITSSHDIADLVHPLSVLQLFGIWPVGDFRLRPANMLVTYVSIGVLVIAAVYGVATALRRRSWGIPLYLLAALTGCFAVIAATAVGHGSPWLNGKALAIASPALVVAGATGAAAMFEGGRIIPAAVCALVIAGGVGSSNLLAYGNVWLASHAQMAELASIDNRYAGDGPTLMLEDSWYGCMYFLRKVGPECISEGPRTISLRTGGGDNASYSDPDAFQLSSILAYRTLVQRTSPLDSRPPSVYRLVWRGTWYEVWQRPARARRILDHLSLGHQQQPTAVAPCSAVHGLAALAAANGGTVVGAERAPTQTFDLTQVAHPSPWQTGSGGTLVPNGPGTTTLTITVPRSGVYGFWLGGSFRDNLALDLDGAALGSVTDQLNQAFQLTPFGTADLTAGVHQVVLRYSGPGLAPGSRGGQFPFGPLVIGLPAADARLVTLNPANAGSLCGASLDWIEAVAH